MRYYAHPESCCVWMEPDGVHVGEACMGDGCVEEIDLSTYNRLVLVEGYSDDTAEDCHQKVMDPDVLPYYLELKQREAK